jgi:hypothetical protein
MDQQRETKDSDLTTSRMRRPLSLTTSRLGHRAAPGTVLAGHISGTSRRDLPRNDENRRDLSHRSDRMHGASVLTAVIWHNDRPARPSTDP